MSENKFVRFWIMWRHNGENHWEACTKAEAMPLVRKLLLEEGVNPASIFFTTDCHWMCPEHHGKKKNVWPLDFLKEIDGGDVAQKYTGPNVYPEPKPVETKYGFISPDGRYFQCTYGGHSELARQIVGQMQKIDDPTRYLEDFGWLSIYKDPIRNNKYAVGMGINGKITDAQVTAIERVGLDPMEVKGLADLLRR